MSCKEASDILTLIIVFGGAILGFQLYCWISVWSARRDMYRAHADTLRWIGQTKWIARGLERRPEP